MSAQRFSGDMALDRAPCPESAKPAVLPLGVRSLPCLASGLVDLAIAQTPVLNDLSMHHAISLYHVVGRQTAVGGDLKIVNGLHERLELVKSRRNAENRSQEKPSCH